MSPSGAGAPADPSPMDEARAPEPPERLLSRLTDPALRAVGEKVLARERLSFEDGLVLFRTADLVGLGVLANRERERRHGNRG